MRIKEKIVALAKQGKTEKQILKFFPKYSNHTRYLVGREIRREAKRTGRVVKTDRPVDLFGPAHKAQSKTRKTTLRVRTAKKDAMKTYLLTWNPKRSSWNDLPKEANQTAADEIIKGRWSCGNTKQMPKGSRVFLIRLGLEPKGIMASGWVNKTPYLNDHWEEEKASKGAECLFIMCEWERILDPNIDSPLSLTVLQRKLNGVNWTSQASGIEIPGNDAARLENLWASHLGASILGAVYPDAEIAATEGAERLALIRHRRRERKLRAAKLIQFRQKNGGLYCEVPKCGFNFEKVYGAIGKDFAHVHHLKPLGNRESPSETLLDDLGVVCANCHAMIHRGGKCRALNELIP